MDIAKAKRRENIAEYILYLWQLEDLLRALQFSPEAIYSTLIAPRKDIAEEQKHLFLMWYLDLANLLQQEGKAEKGHLEHTLHLIRDLHDLHLQLMKLPAGEHYRATYARLEPELPRLRAVLGNPGISDTELCFRALYAAMLYRIKGEGGKSAVSDTIEFISPVIAELADIHGKVERGEMDLFKSEEGKEPRTRRRQRAEGSNEFRPGCREIAAGAIVFDAGESTPRTSFGISPEVESLDIVVHVETVADREVALTQTAHPHVLVEAERPVAPVHVQLHAAGLRLQSPDMRHRRAEEEGPGAAPLEAGQHVDLLQVEQPFALPLDGDIAARLAVARSDVEDMASAQLLPQALLRVHPLHHVVQLCGREQLPVGRRESHAGQRADQRNIGLRGLSTCKHGIKRKRAGLSKPTHVFFLQED